MAKKKYLPLYYKWMKTGQLPGSGLCGCAELNEFDIKIFIPTEEEFELATGGIMRWQAWGYDGYQTCTRSLPVWDVLNKFTPMRQNIILLMAAMAGEL